MKTTTLLTVLYPVSAEDLTRLGIEIGKDEAGQTNFAVKFLSTRPTDLDAVRAYKELWEQIFKKPGKALFHMEDLLEEHSDGEKASRVVKIEDKFISGDSFV